MEAITSSPPPVAPGTNLACPRCKSVLWIPIQRTGNMLFLKQPQLPMVAIDNRYATG